MHAVLTKMVFFCIDIIPGQKSDSTYYNQPHNRKINQWISHIRSQGRIQMIRFSKKIKSCIAECGYRMKQRHPDSFSAVIPKKNRQKKQRPQQFNSKGSFEDKTRQAHNSAYLRGRNRILHRASLHQGNFSPGKHRNRNSDRNHTKTTDLNEQQNHALSKDGPVASCISDCQSCHTGG